MNVLVARTACYFAAIAVLGAISGLIGPTLLTLAAHTDSSAGEISRILVASALGFLLGSALGGQLYDRRLGHPIMAGALLVLAPTLALVPLSPSLTWLFVTMLVLGLAQGVIDVGSNTLLLWSHTAHIRPLMNGLHFCYGVGLFLAPLLVAQTLLWTGAIVWAYWTVTVLIALLGVAVATLPSPAIVAAHPDATRGGGGRAALIALAAALFFLYVGAEVSLDKWLAPYAETQGIADKVTAAYIASGFALAFTLSRLVSILLATRLRPAQMLVASLLGCLVFSLPLLPTETTLWATSLGALGLGASIAPGYPTLILFVEERTVVTSKVLSLFGVLGGVGAMLLPWVVGQLFDPLGPHVLAWTVVAAAIVQLAVFIVMVVSAAPRPTPVAPDKPVS